MRSLIYLPLFIILPSLWSCAQQDEQRFKDRALLEGEAGAQKSREVENEFLRQKASEMEADLSSRHEFYQAAKGTYEGFWKEGTVTYDVRLKLMPTLAPYTGTRVRTIEEIVSDLNGLALSAQILHWVDGRPDLAVGCVFTEVRPDISKKRSDLAGSGCSNTYSLQFLEDEQGGLFIALQMQSSQNAEMARATLKRIAP